MNLACVLHLLGRLCTVLAGLLLIPLLVCVVDGTLLGRTAFAFVIASLCALVAGLALQFAFRFEQERFHLPEAFASVATSWLVFGVVGALPFLLTGSIPRFVDACFETVSGATTCGASILPDPSLLDRPLLFWRAFVNFVGGLGIVALSIAILPSLGAGGNFLFQAEAAGPEKDKIVPRIATMSKLLWSTYFGLTAATTAAYALAGMGVFDALCHAFATIATGGFSTRADSMASYPAAVQWTAIIGMFLGGANFVLLMSCARGRIRPLLRSTELRFYAAMLVCISAVSVVVRVQAEGVPADLEPLVRGTVFDVVSLGTTTGFATVDYDAWPPVLLLLMACMMVIGGCAGSTAGGIKPIRFVLLWKATGRQLRSLLRPTTVSVVRVEDRAIPDGVVFRALLFLCIYLATWAVCSAALIASGNGIMSSVSGVLACLSTVGPGFDAVGPTDNYSLVTDSGKWVLIGAMLLGRLEFFSVLVLFSPLTWRR